MQEENEEDEEDEEDIDEDGSEDQVMYLYSSIEIHPAKQKHHTVKFRIKTLWSQTYIIPLMIPPKHQTMGD